jgi:hypothetical protein
MNGGGIANQYVIDGETLEVPVAPAGFSPLTASDTVLEAYGLPPRPTEETDLAAWKADMSAWRPTPDHGL